MPDFTGEVRARLSSLRLSPVREAEIVEELSQHLDDRWRELIAGGVSSDDATRVTLEEFKDRNLLARDIAPLRQAHTPPPIAPGTPNRHLLGDFVHDVRYAIRTMAAKPGFTATVILSLAIGIGANTAIFSLWNGVSRASLPAVRAPHELVMLSNPDRSGMWTGRADGVRSWLTYEEFEQLRDHADSFSDLMASQTGLSTWQVRFEGGAWEGARGRSVSGAFFDVLGVRPAIGRVFTSEADRVEMPHAVLSHTYWMQRFGGRSDVLGKTFTLRKAALTIVGVAAPGFIGETSGQQPDFWIPLRMQPRVFPGRQWLRDTPPTKTMWLHVFGRLKPGVTQAHAEAQANALFQAGLQSFYGSGLSEERRREFLDQRLELQSGARGASPVRKSFSSSLTALLVAVGVLLLIACANLANLLLARGAARKTEIALRLSLGASRGRLVRQLVTESLVLALCGAVAAISIASLSYSALVSMLTESESRFSMTFSLDPSALAFLSIATFAAVVLFGALPAWQVTRIDAGASLKDQSRGAVGAARQMRSGRLLVCLQLALSLPLLVGAGVLARTAYNLQRADLGFSSDRLSLVRVDLRDAESDPARREMLLRELVATIQRLPGVQVTSYSQLGIFTGGESSETIEVEGYTPTSDDDRGSALDAIGPRYFSALAIPIRTGREIVERDDQSAPKVCVINEAFAKQFFAGRNPIGLHITAVGDGTRTTYRVVGVAGDARTQSLRDKIEPRYFIAAAQEATPLESPILLIRSAADTGAVNATVRKAIAGVNAAIPIMSASSVGEEMRPLTAEDRTVAQLAIVFASVALTLAAIGLYGILSYGVTRRTGEIAIRIALGAQSNRVVSMILRETTGIVAIGLTLGAGLAYVMLRLIESRLYGVPSQDPITLTVATMLLLLVALTAAYLPAHRASRVDPMEALRQW